MPTLRLPAGIAAPRLLLALAAAALLAACAAPRPQAGAGAPARAAARRAADTLLLGGEYGRAALAYEDLARKSEGSLAARYWLLTAATLVDDRQPGAAEKLVQRHLGGPLASDLALARDYVLARANLANHRPALALRHLRRQFTPSTPIALVTLVSELRPEALAAAHHYLEAAQARAALDHLLPGAEARRRNDLRLWRNLLQAPEATLGAAPDRLGTGTLAGWLQLAYLAKRHGADRQALGQAIEQWQQRFPDHPAAALVLPRLLRVSNQGAETFAVLLPFGGEYSAAADAIRNGFVAAWYASPEPSARPSLVFYDTDNASPTALYARAVARGARFVTGPLIKSAVEKLAGATPRPVPVLALNYAGNTASASGTAPAQPATPAAAAPVERPSTWYTLLGPPQSPSRAPASGPGGASPAAFYQFALSPESEARAVAERAWFDGLGRAAVLAPDSAFGQRVARAFAARWATLGGLLVAQQAYPARSNDLAPSVKALLEIDQSEQRYRRLRAVLGRRLEHEARRRQDVDFIFVVGDPRQVRLIKPLLRFYHAGNLPVYAPSMVYSGKPDPDADRDLDGIVFPEMPWLIPGATTDQALRHRIDVQWPHIAPGYRRLYAFGVDAYRLAARLDANGAQGVATLDGATGDLTLGPGDRILRKLIWVHFVDGIPKPLEAPAPAPATGATSTSTPEASAPTVPTPAPAPPAAPGSAPATAPAS